MRAGQTVMVVSHGGFLSCLYQHIVQNKAREGVGNCSIGEVLVSGSVMAVMSWNQRTEDPGNKAHSDKESGFGGAGFG